MLRIDINKNIEDYEKDFVFSMSFGKCIGVLICLVVYILFIFFVSKKISTIIAVLLGNICFIPIVFLFYGGNGKGVSLFKIIKNSFRPKKEYMKSTIHVRKEIDRLLKEYNEGKDNKVHEEEK